MQLLAVIIPAVNVQLLAVVIPALPKIFMKLKQKDNGLFDPH